jgi:uncharacterized LabA/DUF88 family protein
VPEEIALFIDFENIRYSMLNIQRREPDPQELIAVARRYGTVMVARAYADWSRQPEPFKGSLTAAMIDRVDCPAKQRDRIRMGTVHYPPGGSPGLVTEQGSGPLARQWPSGPLGNSGPLPAITPPGAGSDWAGYSDSSESKAAGIDEDSRDDDESTADEGYLHEYAQREPARQFHPFPSQLAQSPQPTPGASLNTGSSTGPLGYPGTPVVHTGNTGHLPAVSAGGANTIVQSTVTQSTVDLNMLMDIIETVFDRPSISTFVLMTGDKDFTRISARLKLRLNKTVIVVGIPGTVSRDLISSANQFVPLIPGGGPVAPGQTGQLGQFDAGYPAFNATGGLSISGGNTGSMPAITPNMPGMQASPYPASGAYAIEVLDPQFLQFLDYIDRNWSWRTIIGVSNFIGDPLNPKNRFRGRLTRESARELLNICIQQGILLLQTDSTGAEDLRLNRAHPGVDEVLKQIVR